MGLTQTVAPTEKVTSIAAVREHLRIDCQDEDNQIDPWIDAATEVAQDFTGRQFVTATYAYTLGRFLPLIKLPRPPLGSVTSIQYVDDDGATQTESTSIYTVISDVEVPYIVEAYDQTWSSTRNIPNAVTITFTAGYGAASAVPDRLKTAVAMMAADMYENRSQTTELRLTDNKTFDRLLWPYRVQLF